jgi:hypothetical protein
LRSSLSSSSGSTASTPLDELLGRQRDTDPLVAFLRGRVVLLGHNGSSFKRVRGA